MEMKLEIVSRETIKPFSPTPPDLKTFLLSYFDQQSHIQYYMQLLYFYNNNNSEFIFSSKVLKNSLSKALVRYYPFAGRLSNDTVCAGAAIDCNDEGVTFLEAKLLNSTDMSEIISNLKTKCSDADISEFLFSDNLLGKDQRFNPLLSVQITHFDCGGIAVSIFISHKIADMTTFVNFMNDWASIARSGCGDGFSVSRPPPRFDTATFFPPDEEPARYMEGDDGKIKEKQANIGNAFKRLEIDNSKIARLKSIVGERVENPSRVQVVSALIFKALANISKNQPTSLIQTMNLRRRFVPSLLDNLTGNIVSKFIGLSIEAVEQKETEMWKLVADMKESMENYCNKYPRKYIKPQDWSSLQKTHTKEFMDSLMNVPNQRVFMTNSWCRMAIYEADFGWGKPIWFTFPLNDLCIQNYFLLMDTKDGDGIEVSMIFDTKQMATQFETNIIQEQVLLQLE